MLGAPPEGAVLARSRKRLVAGGVLAVVHLASLMALADGTLLQRAAGGAFMAGLLVALVRLHRPRGMPWYMPMGVWAGWFGTFIAFDVGAAAVDDGPPEPTTWERAPKFAAFIAAFGVVSVLTLTWSGLRAIGFAAGGARAVAGDRLSGEIVHEISLDERRKLVVALDTSDGRPEPSALIVRSEPRPLGDVWKADHHPFSFPAWPGPAPEPGGVFSGCETAVPSDISYCVIVGPATATSFVADIGGVHHAIEANEGVGVLVDGLHAKFVGAGGRTLLGEIWVG